jgi:carboxymethylenebutenolidase
VRTAELAEGAFAEPGFASQPGVVVIPDVWGLSDHTRDIAQRLAREGFAALALDLYRKTGRPSLADPAAALAWIRELSDPLVLETVQEGIDALAHHPAVAGQDPAARAGQDPAARAGRKVGLIGFCMGGQYAWLAACTCRGLSAVAPFYGMLRYEPGLDPTKKPREPLAVIAALSCPALGLYGREDALIPNADVDELEARLAQQPQPFEIVRYAGAGHAFLNDTRPAMYRPEPAADAWRRLLAFLRARLQ